ncbi:hypothetical protein M440DRAFT_252862 [Trichoderma longibrachiatum ATCC 18648]|uniref:Uncharacterized protein n=1 Tax=Trichoderma longibrachiatum ATCC 18648 TaxID=983965 RepID=A0A2T4C959_TRILO|nr:hypothetical protein M440DRAFT_252862 [Trichoderma longibrachiatum ATCC 18648]
MPTRDGAQCSGSPPLSLPRCFPLLAPLSAHGGSRRLFSLAIAVEDMKDWMRIRWCGWVPAATGVVGNCPGVQRAVERTLSIDDRANTQDTERQQTSNNHTDTIPSAGAGSYASAALQLQHPPPAPAPVLGSLQIRVPVPSARAATVWRLGLSPVSGRLSRVGTRNG